MKLTLETQKFVDSVAWATKSYDSKDEKSYVVLSVNKDGQGRLIHVNQSSYMAAPLEIANLVFENDEVEALIALDGNYIQRFASSIAKMGSEIVLSKNLEKKTSSLVAKVGKSKFTIPVLRVTPDEEPELVKIAEVNDSDFFNSLQRLSKLCSVSDSDSGAPTGSVTVKFDEDTLVCMGTDLFSLGEIIIDYSPTEDKEEVGSDTVLIPASSATMIAPSKVSTDTVELVYDAASKKFGYRFDDTRLALFSLDQSTPLPYGGMKSTIQDSVEHNAILDMKLLKSAIGTISALAWDEVDVKINVDGKRNAVWVTDENGNNKIEVPVESMDFDDEFEITFMRLTINKSFFPISTPMFQLSFSNAESTFVLQPVLDDGSIDDNVFATAVPSI